MITSYYPKVKHIYLFEHFIILPQKDFNKELEKSNGILWLYYDKRLKVSSHARAEDSFLLNGWVKNNPSRPKCYGILH